jgi:hypothetical protein
MSDTIIQKIRFLQHNCARSTNTMISCLEYELKKKINIICIQESWIDSNQIIISHSTFNRILLEQKDTHRQSVVMFVSKTFKFSVTSRSNLCSDTNIQILNISRTNIENLIILNVYNEKCQKSNSDEYTIERKCQSATREVRRLWYSAIGGPAMNRNWLVSKLREITRLKTSTSCN